MPEEEATERRSEEAGGQGAEAVGEEGKRDIKALVAVIPPAAALRRRERRVREKRIRVRWSDDLKPDEVAVHPELAKELGISTHAEIVIAGRHRFVARVILNDSQPVHEVYCNSELLREHGVADNSIATIRASKQQSG